MRPTGQRYWQGEFDGHLRNYHYLLNCRCPYDQQGNIMSRGRNFSFDPVNGLTESIVPGYGTTPPPLIVPNFVWGGGTGAFTSTTNSNQVQSGNGCGQK